MKLEPLIHEENLKRLRKLLTRAPREDPHLLGIMRIAVAFRAYWSAGQGPTRSAPGLTQHHIGFAFGARGSGVGSACRAARRRHHRPAGPAIPCVLGHHDGGNDVSDRRAHDPRFP